MEGGTKCVKYMVFIFNFIFFLSGCGLIGLGVWLNIERDDWQGISDYSYISVANVVIAAGAIIVVVSFLGCCGAITENKYMLFIFFIFLVIIFLLELGAGIAAYIWRGEIEDDLKTQIRKRIPSRYYTETGVKKSMDSIQKEFQCCGVDGFTDWVNPISKAVVDKSCCKRSVATCSTKSYPDALATKSDYNDKGCYNSIRQFLEDNLLYVGLCGIIFAVFQIIGMVFAMVLFCSINRQSNVV